MRGGIGGRTPTRSQPPAHWCPKHRAGTELAIPRLRAVPGHRAGVDLTAGHEPRVNARIEFVDLDIRHSVAGHLRRSVLSDRVDDPGRNRVELVLAVPGNEYGIVV